jgi:hypothetical protein
MRNKFVLGLILAAVMLTGLTQAALLTVGSVETAAVTFASNVQFDHEFQAYDVISDQYFNITDTDIMKANAHTFETGGLPLVSSPFSGKVYVLPQEFTVSDDWIECIALGGMAAVEPLGRGLELPSGTGNWFYSTGGVGPSGDGVDRYEYMATTGWDPFVLWQHMGGS